MAKTAKVYARQMLEEVNAERVALGKPPIYDEGQDCYICPRAVGRLARTSGFAPRAKTLAQDGFTPPEHFNHSWGGAPRGGTEAKRKDTPKRVFPFGTGSGA